MNEASCTDCELELAPDHAGPCPGCGSLARTVSLRGESASVVTVTGELTAELTPGGQARDWRDRWEWLEQTASMLASGKMTPLGGTAVAAGRNELHAFFVQCYHLKDLLLRDDPSGIACSLERRITTTPELALIADLANLDKHGKLSKPPRSGAAPTFGKLSGRTLPKGAGWEIRYEIHHAGRVLDGVRVALDAVAAWRRVLTAAGVI